MDTEIDWSALQPTDDQRLPQYSDPGSILVWVSVHPDEPAEQDRLVLDVLDYDADSSVFWINEGVGIDCWLREHVTFPHTGMFLVIAIRGSCRTYDTLEGMQTDEHWEKPRVELMTMKAFAFWYDRYDHACQKLQQILRVTEQTHLGKTRAYTALSQITQLALDGLTSSN